MGSSLFFKDFVTRGFLVVNIGVLMNGVLHMMRLIWGLLGCDKYLQGEIK